MIQYIKSWMVCVAVTSVLAGSASAASLTTTFVGGSGASGNMFDVQIFGKSILVTGLTIHKATTGTSTLEVYTKAGTYAGSETTPGAWTLASTTSATGAPGSDGTSFHGVGTFVDITDFLLPAGTLNGLYVTLTTESFNYTVGANVYADANLQVSTGIGNAYPFSVSVSPRTWNGTIHYSTIPEPSTFALFGMIGAGIALMRRRRNLRVD